VPGRHPLPRRRLQRLQFPLVVHAVPDPELDDIMDSANPEQFRGLPTTDRLTTFRSTVAERVHARIGDIAERQVGAPDQLSIVETSPLSPAKTTGGDRPCSSDSAAAVVMAGRPTTGRTLTTSVDSHTGNAHAALWQGQSVGTSPGDAKAVCGAG
jgi:hypothetical protein